MNISILLRGLTKRLQALNFAENWSEKYRPIEQEITKFDEDTIDKKWLTQYHFGCLLFSLLNGNFFDSKWKSFFDFNLDFSNELKMNRSKKQKIIGVTHEYKAILLWGLITGNNVVHGNFNNIKQMIHQMLESKSLEKIYEISSKINVLYENIEERFAVKILNGKKLDFAEGSWTIFNRKAVTMEETCNPKFLFTKLKYLERLPKYSLFCLYDHWITFLGCKADKMIFYNSDRPNDFYAVSKNFITAKTMSVFIKR